MGLYSTLIGKLRAKVGDYKRQKYVEWTGDGSATVFQMPTGTFPVLDVSGTYTVKVNGSTKAEGSDYTFDKLSGTLTLLVAPTDTHVVSVTCFAVHLRDEDWMNVINDVILGMGNDFFIEVTDDSTLVTTAGMLTLDISADFPKAIDVYGLWHRGSSSEEWCSVDNFANYRFDATSKKLHFGSSQDFPVSGQPIKIRLLKAYTLGTAISDTLEVQDKFETILMYGSEERYWQFRYQDVVELVTKRSQENTRSNLQELIMLSDRARRLYEQEKAKLKPAKPPRFIPTYIQGRGRP